MTKIKTADAPIPNDDLPWTPPRPSVATRNISRRSRQSARVAIVTPDGREVKAESHTEANAAYCLLADPRVETIVEQPAEVKYVDAAGQERFHTFDFIAILKNGVRVAVVVKPKAVAERRDVLGLTERLAAQVPRHVADRFVLLTEEEVGGDRAHDARLLHSARLHPAPEDDDLVAAHAARANGAVSVAAIASATGLDGRAYRAVSRLVHEGRLRRVDGGRLTLDSLVALAAGEGA